MGQRGPKPRPVALKVPAGNPGGRPVGTERQRGRARRGNPDRPRELVGEAAAEWDRLVPLLDEAGWLAFLDRAVLAAYCMAWAQMVWAEEVIRVEGAVVREPVQTAKGEVLKLVRLKPHPAVKIHSDAAGRVKALAETLGLTPASRGRLEGDGPAGDRPANAVDAIRERIRAARGGV